MKKLIRILILVFTLGFLVPFIVFFFYAKAPNWNVNEYYQFQEFSKNYAPAKDTLTVCTFNIGYFSGMTNNLPVERQEELFDKNMEKSISYLSKIDADIIALQEIDFDADRSYNVDQLFDLGTALNYPLAYRSVNWDKTYLPFPYWPFSKHFGKIISGQAILSKHLMKNPETMVLNRREDVHLLYNYLYIDRLVQMVDWRVGSRVVTVMNVHLEAFDEDTRVLQAEKVKELFESYVDRPVLLMGDFNSTPAYERSGNRALEVLMSAKNIQSVVNKEMYLSNPAKYYSFNSEVPQMMIDHIFYNDKYMTAVSARVDREAGNISDHLPLVAKLVFKK